MRDEYDFSKAKKARDVSHLARLQADATGKTRITIMLDDDVIDSFRAQAEKEGMGYQTLINQTLRKSLVREPLDVESLRKVIREELALYEK